MAVPALADEVHTVIASAFDPEFYAATYSELPAGTDPFWHYVGHGWTEARDPAPWFSAAHYVAENPELKRKGIEPFHHYLTVGRRAGWMIHPSRHAAAYLGGVDWAPEPARIEPFISWPSARPGDGGPLTGAITRAQARAAIERDFDAAFYLATNPDVAASGMEPLAHYALTGWTEGRDPAPGFSVRHYLDTYPDVVAAKVDPFAHYLLAGRAEGREPRHALGFRYDVIARATPVEARIAHAARVAAGLPTGRAADLAERLGALGDLHITFGHDDYLAHAGGVQLSVRREAARFAERGVRHLHLHPEAGWQVVRKVEEPGPLGVMLDGRRLGVFTADAVREALGPATAGAGRRSFAIHSLLGHAPEETIAILAAAGLTRGVFWLHDFASLCAGFHLLRNDVADCGAPPPDSPACQVCAYGPVRARHTEAHRILFERLELDVAAPSENALAFWLDHGQLPHHARVVLPHAELRVRGPAPKPARPRPFRLGFLGVPTALKGWALFQDLAEQLAGDRRYELHHLGARPSPGTAATFHPVVATPERPDAMQDAAEALELDAALIWPLCRETFSLTAHEAAAAGAAVITGPDSGNVAAFVAASGLGRVLADEAALAQAFVSGEILDLARRHRDAMLYDLVYSGLTADLAGPP